MQRASLSAGSTVVEIGPGTGQATRHLAARGLDVVAVELGPHLAERARANLAAFPQVSVVTASFESWDPGAARFDGVFACNSFHWIDPDIRFAKAAAVLRRGGHLVVLATPWVVPETADRFWWDVQDDWAAVGARFDPSTMHPDLIRDDLALAVRASGVFEEPTITRRLFEIAFTADGYATNLSTQSGVKALPENARGGAHRSHPPTCEGPRWARDRPSARRAYDRPPRWEPVRVVVIADPRRSDNIAAGHR